MNVAAPGTGARVETAELLSRYHPESVITETMEGYAVPVATRLSRELLGFAPQPARRRS